MGESVFKHDGILEEIFQDLCGIIEGSKCNHISILKGSQEILIHHSRMKSGLYCL